MAPLDPNPHRLSWPFRRPYRPAMVLYAARWPQLHRTRRLRCRYRAPDHPLRPLSQSWPRMWAMPRRPSRSPASHSDPDWRRRKPFRTPGLRNGQYRSQRRKGWCLARRRPASQSNGSPYSLTSPFAATERDRKPCDGGGADAKGEGSTRAVSAAVRRATVAAARLDPPPSVRRRNGCPAPAAPPSVRQIPGLSRCWPHRRRGRRRCPGRAGDDGRDGCDGRDGRVEVP